jgi:signal recognition particle receptor subunit beta
MVFFNYALRKLNAKIVYYGPGLCGKTTNLMWIHDNFEGGDRGKMISLATEGDRTIFFDLLPLEIGAIRGMDVTLQLYTVPGQVHYNSTRQLVLRGADGVVFVADSQRAMQGSNTDSFKNLQENLLLQGISLDGFPHILQFNKRDLRDVVSIEELNDDLNHYSVPIFEATATDGVGVQETLEGIVKLVMRNLRQRYEGATTGARTPGLEDSQVGIPDALSTPAASPTEVPAPEPISVREPPPPVEPMTPPDPPPVEPVVPPDPLPVEQIVPPDSLPVEPIELPDTLAPEEPAPIESPAAVAFGDADPAETVDFSKVMESDPFGGMGGGFEDEVSTAVYDVNDDSAIDFEELKRLDAKKAPPMPPPTPEASPSAEPPSANSSELNFESLESEFLPPEAPAESPAAFDLESTDAGLKTQHATVLESHDSMAAFDFNATPPDMDSVPEFELEEPQPEAEPEPEPVYQEAEVVDELIPEVAEFEPPPILDPPVEAEAPPFVEEVLPVAAEAAPDTISPPTPAEGMYIDRIEAPSPFAPNPDSPGGSAEALEALSKISKIDPVIGPEETEISPAAVVEEIDEAAEIVEPVETVELVEPFETVEPPPGAFSDDEAEEALPIIDPVAEFEAPPFADHEDVLDAQPIVDINAGFEATPVAEVESELEALPVVDVEAELEAPPIGDVDAEFEPQPVADFEDQIAAMPAAEVEKELEALPTFDVEAELEALPAVKIPDKFEAPPVAEIDAEFEASPVVDAEPEDSPIVDVDAEPEPLPVTDLNAEREAMPVVEIDAEFTAPSVADVEDDLAAPPIVEVEEELETAQAEAGDESFDIPPAATVDENDEFPAGAIDERLFEVTPVVPVVVGSAEPWTEEELSGVYNLGEVEKAEQAAAIEAAAPPRDVEVRAEDNQLHLRLQGTGAIVESGQVRALDIEVPVPGAWVGNRRVTLQLRLTLTPDTEYEDDGSDNPS